MIRLLSYLLICILVIIVLLLIVKVIKLKQIINKRINGEELTLGDFREFNTWKFSPFEMDERKNPEGNRVYVVYQFTGLFGDKHDLESYNNLSDSVRDYTARTRKEIDKIIYNQKYYLGELWLL